MRKLIHTVRVGKKTHDWLMDHKTSTERSADAVIALLIKENGTRTGR